MISKNFSVECKLVWPHDELVPNEDTIEHSHFHLEGFQHSVGYPNFHVFSSHSVFSIFRIMNYILYIKMPDYNYFKK